MMSGYYFCVGRKDFFFETVRKRKDTRFVAELSEKFLAKTGVALPGMDNKYFWNGVLPAQVEEKTIQFGQWKGKKYLNIFGENFCCTTNVVENPYDEVMFI